MTVALLFQGATPALRVWITKQVVDAVAAALSTGKELGLRTISIVIVAWVGTLLMEAVLEPLVTATQTSFSEKLTAYINILLIRKAEGFHDLSHFEDTNFYNNLQLVKQQASYKPLNLLTSLSRGGREFFTTVAMLGLLIPIGWWIPLLILGTTLPQAYVSYKMQMKALEITVEKNPEARLMDYCSWVMLTDSYAKEVRLFKLGSFFISLYLKSFQDVHQAMGLFRRKQVFLSTRWALLNVIGNTLAFYWVVQQAFNQKFSPGSLLLFVQALSYTQQNLSQLVENSTLLYDSLLYLEQLFNFLDSKPIMTICFPGMPVPKPIQRGISFNGVHFCYLDGRSALEGISFVLHPGETVALVGENGSGKTTIVKLLARLYDPTAGVITVDDKDLRELNLEQWRQQIATVFQDFGRYMLTLGENIALGNLNSVDDIDSLGRVSRLAGMAELVERFPQKYRTPLGKQFGGTELSGGEWQKVALARTLLRAEKAQILILDEPTAAIDPRSEVEIYSRFAELSRDKTTLLITHRLASVRMADRILVLKKGHLIEEGTHNELLQHGGEYATLWNIQVRQYGF